MSDFAIRPMLPSDEGFVFKAWLRGYWEHFPARVIVSEAEFMERWHRVIERILADKRAITVVAHVDGDPDALLGFACGNAECLHWAYVKQAFRKLGVCTSLMDSIELRFGLIRCQISHWPGPVDGWTYAPQLLKEYAE